MTEESPEYLRTSTAAAMTMGFREGRFYRNAELYCVNVLLTYDQGCTANCSYCGLQSKRDGEYADKSFIRVEWPKFSVDGMISAIAERKDGVKRICISQITNARAIEDTEMLTRRFVSELGIPVSLLIAPTILKREHLQSYADAGADRIGISFDAATEELFIKHRGEGVNGPHDWQYYWITLDRAVEIFGEGMVGAHLIVGLGETEREMIGTIGRVSAIGGVTHLFSFYPEEGSLLSDRAPPPMGQYRRVQLARHLIDSGDAEFEDFKFDENGRLTGVDIEPEVLEAVITGGEPFMTSGCPDEDEDIVACNRPYANSLPGPDIRNYPFQPNKEDIDRVLEQLWS